MELEWEREAPVPFEAGLPQGSPLSPILFVNYAAAISSYNPTRTEISTTYVDDEVIDAPRG